MLLWHLRKEYPPQFVIILMCALILRVRPTGNNARRSTKNKAGCSSTGSMRCRKQKIANLFTHIWITAYNWIIYSIICLGETKSCQLQRFVLQETTFRGIKLAVPSLDHKLLFGDSVAQFDNTAG
jgi:hypothetical protein